MMLLFWNVEQDWGAWPACAPCDKVGLLDFLSNLMPD